MPQLFKGGRREALLHVYRPAGDVGNLFGGGKACLHQEPVDLAVRVLFPFPGQPPFDGLGQDFVPVDSPAVVDHFDGDVAPLVEGFHRYVPFNSLAGFRPVFRRGFQPVVNGVPDNVDQRVGEGVDHGFVDLRVFSDDVEFHLLVHLFGRVPDHPFHLFEGVLDGNHPQGHDPVLD